MELPIILEAITIGLCLLMELLDVWLRAFWVTLLALYQMLVPREGSVAGELVLITGTGHGIGKELARQYGELNAIVVCVDNNSVSNEDTVQELRRLGVKAHGYTCDVSKREEVALLGSKVRSEVGDVSILVNNAGIMPCKRFLDHTPQDTQTIMNVNVMAHFWMLQEFLPKMVAQNRGHVVAISSILGIAGIPNTTAYCASKFAVRGLMESLCEELRSQDSHIGFTTICPYMVDTGLCTTARIKFPNLFPALDAKFVASEVILAQRRGYREHTVPGYMMAVCKV